MNIFILSKNPRIAAQMMCNKHVVKMILETAQLLCGVFIPGAAPYKRSHYNHPAAKWTRKSQSNYKWLIDHGLALCEEYNYRYGKEHKSKAIILWCKANQKKLKLANIGLTPFAIVVPEIYRSSNVVSSYRKYYLGDKKRIAEWKIRKPPGWWK